MPTPAEERFAWFARQLEVIPEAEVDNALVAAEEARAAGSYADVRSVLLGKQLLTLEQGDQLLRELDEVVMVCPVCSQSFPMTDYDPDAHCPKDVTLLRPALAPEQAGKAKKPADTIALSSVPEGPAPPSKRTRKRAFGSFGAAAESASDPLVGQQFGNFRLLNVLSTSERSSVYEARLGESSDAFAVKVLRSTDYTIARRFMREARLTMLINHPNIVQMIEIGEAQDHLYLAMEYVAGHNLLGLIEAEDEETGDKSLPVTEAVQIVIEALAGLDAAHRIGIVHRDFSPANILVSPLEVKVADFGSARMVNEEQASAMLTANDATLGTVAYIAPEQFESPKVDFRADLYAAGATLFHLLTGRVVFEGKNAMEIAMQKMQQEPPKPSSIRAEVPPALDHVVMKLLAKEPEARFASATDASDALQQALL